MKAAITIARQEWRHWTNTRVAQTAGGAFVALLLGVSTLTAVRMVEERQQRQRLQVEAERRFATQPDRHPHRMVHYGHYAFRPPAPLAVIDPGLHTVTGTSLFLEGHRQNSATFAEARASANTGADGPLSTAFAYRVLVPLLLIALGHGVLARERETGGLTTVLSLGVSRGTLVAGKALALLGLVCLLSVPLWVAATVAVAMGEAWPAAVGLCVTYCAYLALWATAVLAASTWARNRGTALAALAGAWLLVTVVVPRVGVGIASAGGAASGHIERALGAEAELMAAGDGHDASSPAFAALRARLLATHGVKTVEALPVNLRGVVAERSEAQLSEVLNRHASERMKAEAEQAERFASLGWLSPAVALGVASRTLAGTDLATHHRFLREAEGLRFSFVQRLNRLHATELSYADDVRRSSDADAEQRTRISADNWSLLDRFAVSLTPARERYRAARLAWGMLLAWTAAMLMATAVGTRRLRP